MRQLDGALQPLAVAMVLASLLVACGSKPEAAAPPPVTSYLAGRVTVNAAIDSIPDYRGFELVVAFEGPAGQLDTLGYAVTDSSGTFQMDVTAPDRGIYPLIISRRGTVLKVDELAVAAGDSATLQVELPVGSRPLRIRSQENAAWMAYRNTKAQYNQAVMQLVKDGSVERGALSRSIEQATSILWSLQDNYPNTIAADVAVAEAAVMLEGWNDSLLLARAAEIEPDNPSFVEVVRASRRAEARLHGQASAVEKLTSYIDAVDDEEKKAALQAELVQAYQDSLQQTEALEAARALKRAYPESRWVPWADRAIYELENLMPGMAAPAFTATTVEGEALSLATFEGRPVVLEFYLPNNQLFQQQLPVRNSLLTDAPELALVSFSMQPDTLLNEGFREGREFPGQHVVLPEGGENPVVKAYNINLLPTRVLIDRKGRIVGKYAGEALLAMQQAVRALEGDEGAADEAVGQPE